MYIAVCGHEFPDDESRVSFTLSYLKGTPLDWFQTELSHAMNTGDDLPEWFVTYKVFLDELQHLFGPRDPVADAVTALEGLKYKDSTKATQYIIEFNRHSRHTGWNDVALARQFYKPLPDRLKDEIARIGKPTDLQELQDLVATLDQRYWERQTEISRDKRSAHNNPASNSNKAPASDNRSDNRSNNQNTSGSKSNNPQQQSKKQDHKKPNPASSSSSSSNTTNTIADLLGPDGKLKPEECQRRIDKNLCLCCGKSGHTVSNCPTTSKAKPKGRAATVTSTPTPAASTPASSGKA